MGVWDPRGPEIDAGAAFHGLLVTRGDFVSQNGGTLYGAVVAHSVLLNASVGPPTRIFRDASLNDGWPPAGWELPRFVVSRVSLE